MTEEEKIEIEKKSAALELQLDGHVYLVQKDKDGKEILKEELDPKLFLEALKTVISSAVEHYGDLNLPDTEQIP